MAKTYNYLDEKLTFEEVSEEIQGTVEERISIVCDMIKFAVAARNESEKALKKLGAKPKRAPQYSTIRKENLTKVKSFGKKIEKVTNEDNYSKFVSLVEYFENSNELLSSIDLKKAYKKGIKSGDEEELNMIYQMASIQFEIFYKAKDILMLCRDYNNAKIAQNEEIDEKE